MARRKIALIMAPVHHCQVGGLETLARVSLGPWESGDHRTDLVGLAQKVLSVPGIYQVVEDRAGHDPKAAQIERDPTRALSNGM